MKDEDKKVDSLLAAGLRHDSCPNGLFGCYRSGANLRGFVHNRYSRSSNLGGLPSMDCEVQGLTQTSEVSFKGFVHACYSLIFSLVGNGSSDDRNI
jgi:hypothetical protein